VPSKFLIVSFVGSYSVINFLSTGILNSLVFYREIYIFEGRMHVSTLPLFGVSTIFVILVGNAENGEIALLSPTSIRNCLTFNCFSVERGVLEQQQVDDHISLPAYDFLLEVLCDIFVAEQFLNLICSPFTKYRNLDISLDTFCCYAGRR
jgi:hypothetical protein